MLNKLVGQGVLAALAFVSIQALAMDRVVINEIRKLRDSLPVSDAQRPELGLRLADLMSGECLVSSAGTETSRAKDCREALSLYQENLVHVPSAQQTRIRFQMARILLERGDTVAARTLFAKVLSEAEEVELKRESAFRLAEIEEANPATEKLAESRYQAALALCNGGDSCSYSHYRLAWIHKRRGELPQAIEEMKLALYDAKGQARGESVRDLVVFMGQDTREPSANITYVETLSNKLGQPKMLEDLAFAYLTGANKASGVKVLEVLNARQPTIARELKLLEETYGARDWDRFESHLASLEKLAKDSDQIAAMTETAELEKASKRIAIQLDGERKTRPERTADYKAFSLVALELFPKAADNARVMEGWVAAETDGNAKLAKLKEWTQSTRYNLSANDRLALHELRAGIAQKEKNYAVVAEEMNALLAASPTAAKAAEYRYSLAKAAYDQKDYAKALPLFQALSAEGAATGNVDKYAIQSQHLALDILNQQKDLAGIEKQAALWTTNAKLRGNAKVAADLKEMGEVSEQAEFERAVSLGETPDALTKFRSFCEANRFTPKSCENAKTLAVRLNSHADLVAILAIEEAGGKSATAADDLAAEYEAGGQFAESAKLQEKTLTKQGNAATLGSWLKVALSYELASDTASRDRVLVSLQKRIPQLQTKPSENEQFALAEALQDAGLVTPAWLKLAGAGAAYRSRLAEALEARGQGTAETRKMLLSDASSTGPGWQRLVLEEARALQQKQAGLHFYGKNGERLFQSRVAALKRMNDFVSQKLSGATAENRVKLLKLSQAATDGLAKEILSSPLPASLNDEQKKNVQASLAELAKPFQDRSEATAKLLGEELAKATDPSQRQRLDQLAATELDKIVADEKAAAITQTAPVSSSTLAPSLAALRRNPKDTAALESLRDAYRTSRQDRLALYFEGRLLQIKKEAPAK